VADIIEDAAQERGEGGNFPGTQEGQGMVLDEGWPVGDVCVKGVEEMLLDSVRWAVSSLE
jgi:hypothetical protein